MINRVPDLNLNPSWTTIGKLFLSIVLIALFLTLVVAVAQPLGLLDSLHEQVRQMEASQGSGHRREIGE